MKNKIKYLLWLLFIIQTSLIYAEKPRINCYWLPWCTDEDPANPSDYWSNFTWISFLTKVIWEMIQYVAVIAVIALISSWILYMLSWWEEEKAKKAKRWIIWSLVWVFLSISAWSIINILNLLRFN